MLWLFYPHLLVYASATFLLNLTLWVYLLAILNLLKCFLFSFCIFLIT